MIHIFQYLGLNFLMGFQQVSLISWDILMRVGPQIRV
jgi:hypothetical protein